jgi:hypothetical protein
MWGLSQIRPCLQSIAGPLLQLFLQATINTLQKLISVYNNGYTHKSCVKIENALLFQCNWKQSCVGIKNAILFQRNLKQSCVLIKMPFYFNAMWSRVVWGLKIPFYFNTSCLHWMKSCVGIKNALLFQHNSWFRRRKICVRIKNALLFQYKLLTMKEKLCGD